MARSLDGLMVQLRRFYWLLVLMVAMAAVVAIGCYGYSNNSSNSNNSRNSNHYPLHSLNLHEINISYNMSLTPTLKIPLGFTMPEFNLPDAITNTLVSSDDIKGEKGTLVMFICNHCPYVLHVIHELIKVGYDYLPKGIGVVAINSNDVVNHPDDHPDRMKELALSLKFPYPYLFDETQEVAKAYDAACTPDFNLFDVNGKCVYRGQLDSSRPGNDNPVTGKNLREALDLVLAGEEIPEDQTPSTGCNIKWKV